MFHLITGFNVREGRGKKNGEMENFGRKIISSLHLKKNVILI